VPQVRVRSLDANLGFPPFLRETTKIRVPHSLRSLQRVGGVNLDRILRLLYPDPRPSLPILLPPRALALNIRIEPQILLERDHFHRKHIPNVASPNMHHQNINIVCRIPSLAPPVNSIIGCTSYPRLCNTPVDLSCTRQSRFPESRIKS